MKLQDQPTFMAETLENYEENLPHNEFVQIAKETLKDILERDPYLSDLHPDITVEEVKSLIALEKGQAVKLILDKLDGTSETLVVPQNATVRDLKTAIRRSTNLKLVCYHIDCIKPFRSGSD